MYYGIDIGGTKIELAAFNEKLEKLYTERVPTPQTDYQDWLHAIKTLVERADAHFGKKGTVGLGLPGFVNLTTGLAEVTNIRVADNKPILADLERVLDREVRAENDANCFALSEACDEENTQYPSVLGLILGTGFGGGFVINGKIRAYSLQDQGMDTIEANLALGFKADERNFNVCADMFELLGVKQVRLMTNNPQKVETMKKAGINIVERVPLNVGENRYNTKYLDTKAKKMGHYIVHNNEEHLMTCPHCQEEVI